MSRTDPQFNLRIPADLKEQIEQAAESAGRSATAEIVFRLRASFEQGGTAAARIDAFKELKPRAGMLYDALTYDVLRMRENLDRAELNRLRQIEALWANDPLFRSLIATDAAIEALKAEKISIEPK